MSTLAYEPQSRPRPSRDEALKVAAARKVARRRRTSRIRKAIATVAVAAFIGPFGVIYTQMAAGRDPGLAYVRALTPSAPSSLATGTATASASVKREAASIAAERRAAARARSKAAAAKRAAARKKAAAAATTAASA